MGAASGNLRFDGSRRGNAPIGRRQIDTGRRAPFRAER